MADDNLPRHHRNNTFVIQVHTAQTRCVHVSVCVCVCVAKMQLCICNYWQSPYFEEAMLLGSLAGFLLYVMIFVPGGDFLSADVYLTE